MTTGSSRVLVFLISAILIHLVRITTAADQYLLYAICSDGNTFPSNSTYGANRNSLLSSLSSHTEIDYGFYNFSAGQDTDKVNAIALCRGDVTLETCRTCVNDTSHQLAGICSNNTEAIAWYDNCTIRYSNRPIFGTLETDSRFSWWLVSNLSKPVQFNQVLTTLLTDLRIKAANGSSLLKLAIGEDASSDQKVYGLVQCTPDLNHTMFRLPS